MMKAPLSMCLIARNEPFLEKCVLSFKDYVQEIVIVSNDPFDQETREIALKYGAKFSIITECNDAEGRIEDFSILRQKSFDLATQPWIAWVDSDDEIVGAQHFAKYIDLFEQSPRAQDLDTVAFLLPYEYGYNDKGQCCLQHYRERIFKNKVYWKWRNPVHEVVVPKEGIKLDFLPIDDIIYKHRRQTSGKVVEGGRNLRILRKFYEKIGESDPRQLYYLGLECCNAGDIYKAQAWADHRNPDGTLTTEGQNLWQKGDNLINEAVTFLKRYGELSQWSDEIVMSRLKLVEIFINQDKLDEGLDYAFKCLQMHEKWAESYWAIAKIYYFMANKAQQNGKPSHQLWEKCIYFIELGLRLPPTKTLLFINPLERSLHIYEYLNMAQNSLGRVKEALESCRKGLESEPEHPGLKNNAKLYEIHFAKEELLKSLTLLRDYGEFSEDKINAIIKLLDREDLLTVEPLLNLPPPVPEVNLPILDTTFTEISPINKLDIIFVTGQGIENWNPETIQKTGIGGSELMCASLAAELAKLGHTVRVYNSCGSEGIYNGVHYIDYRKFKNLKCDILIVSRQACFLDDQFKIDAKAKFLWVHDLLPQGLTSKLLLRADRILALSQFHKNFILSNYKHIDPDKIIVTRNGIELSLFDTDQVTKNPYKAICFSSPDRYLPVLLKIWPRIRQAVPQAELTVAYGFKNWEFAAQQDEGQKALIQSLKETLAQGDKHGIKFVDRINQAQLAQELLSAGVWTYSNHFWETSCISLMQAMAAGVRPICSRNGALPETGLGLVTLIDGDWSTDLYQEEFIQKVIEAMTQPDNGDRVILRQAARENFGLPSLASDWQAMFTNIIAELSNNPLGKFITV